MKMLRQRAERRGEENDTFPLFFPNYASSRPTLPRFPSDLPNPTLFSAPPVNKCLRIQSPSAQGIPATGYVRPTVSLKAEQNVPQKISPQWRCADHFISCWPALCSGLTSRSHSQRGKREREKERERESERESESC